MVAENDPYNDLMNSEKNDIRPGFLGGNGDGDKAAGALAAAESIASAALAAKGGGAAAAGKAGDAAASGGAKKAMSDGMKDGAQDGVKKADAAEKNPGGFYNKNNSGDDEPSLKMSKGAKRGLMAGLAVAAPFLIILLVIGGIVALLIGLPVLMIGGIDYNLMKVLGFEETIGILEEQGEHVTAEFAKNGKMPKDYFQDLVANGIDVGQITANGDFVRTDTYIANIENRDDLVAAASGFLYISEEEGELAMLWDGEVIRADDFVAAVESDPNLYAAYSKAADIDTKYYYSEGVEEVYQDMGLSRGNFNDFEVSGNYEEDDEKFLDILNKTLENGSNIVVGGALDNQKANSEGTTMIEEDGDTPCDDSSDGGTYCREVSEMDASSASSQVAENTKEYIIRWEWVKNDKTGLWFWQPVYSSNSTRRAAELLNTAVSSNEPYLASNAFVAVEEAIQRARIEGGGPVNHVMNALTRGKEVSYQNVETGAIETSNLSILETRNFRAAVSDSKYSKEEAQNFGRDRVLKTTGQADSDIIKRTTVGTSGKSSANSVVRNGKGGEADSGTVARANENLELSDSKNNPEAFQSVIGGNRIIEGGSMLSNTINMHRIGAMPSDAGTIAAYHQEVEKTMARRAEAERASKNPFDISNPYTFLGSIVHNFAITLLGSYGSNMTGILALSSAGNVAGKAVANLANAATAQGGDDEFTTMSGLGCETVGSAGGIEGDLYCTSHNTVSTKYMSNTQGDWDGVIDEGAYEDFTLLAMDRYSSVGTKDAGVCEKYNELHGGIGSKIGNFFKQMFGIYEACKIEVDENDDILESEKEKLAIYTGGAYSFGSEKTEDLELMSGYALYTEVKSLLSGEESATAAIRREYYAKHPKDNSEAAAIARRSGMTKSEAEIALAYSDYLNMIANYDPSGRQMVTTPVISFDKPILEYHSDEVALNLYAWYLKQTEYDDLRTRNFVV